MALIESFLERGVFYTEGSPYFNRIDTVFFKAHFFCDKQPLLQLYSIAVLFPVHVFIKFNDALNRSLLYAWAVMSSSGFFFVALFFLMKRALTVIQTGEDHKQWVITSLFLGSILLPFATTYSNHLAEAVLIFWCFLLLLEYRLKPNHKSPVHCAILLGVSALVHIAAGLIFIFLTGLYFITEKVSHFFRFLFCVLAIFIAGAGINVLVQGDAKPFYLTPELYIYEKSFWLGCPAFDYLKRQDLEKRCEELKFSKALKDFCLFRYDAYIKYRPSFFGQSWKTFLKYDFFVFNPIFLTGFGLIFVLIFKRRFLFRKEALWVLCGCLGMYFVLIHTRLDNGTSYGNRHLIPVIPLVYFFLGFHGENEKKNECLKFMLWIIFCTMIPGIIQPWADLDPSFLRFNFILNGGLIVLCLVSYFYAPFRNGVSAVYSFFCRQKFFAVGCLLFFLALELAFYYGLNFTNAATFLRQSL